MRSGKLFLMILTLVASVLGCGGSNSSTSAWHQLGAQLNSAPITFADGTRFLPFSHITLDDQGRPVATWGEAQSSGATQTFPVNVKYWDGSVWQKLGSPVNISIANPIMTPRLAAGGGALFVAWAEQSSGIWQVNVKKWNGSQSRWDDAAGSSATISDTAKNSFVPSLAVDQNGRPVVAWLEEEVTGGRGIVMKRLQSGVWLPLGSTFQASALDSTYNDFGDTPELQLDQSGAPALTLRVLSATGQRVYVVRLNNSNQWVQWGGSSLNDGNGLAGGGDNLSVFTPTLTFNSKGNPAVAWWGGSGSNAATNRGYVAQYDGNGNWIQIAAPLPSAGTYTSYSFNGSLHLKFAPGDVPVVAYDQNFDGLYWKVFVARYEGSQWVLVGGALNTNSNYDDSKPPSDASSPYSAFHPEMVLDASGNPLVSWHEGNPGALGPYSIYVKHYTSL